jgi:large subunit ribosomal protein L10
MNKQEKASEIDALGAAVKSVPTAFVLAPKGLTVNQVSTLRRRIRASHGSFRVVKNRLALRAIKGSPLEGLAPHFKGETAIAYSAADSRAARPRSIQEFGKEITRLTIKAGLSTALVDRPTSAPSPTCPRVRSSWRGCAAC